MELDDGSKRLIGMRRSGLASTLTTSAIFLERPISFAKKIADR